MDWMLQLIGQLNIQCITLNVIPWLTHIGDQAKSLHFLWQKALSNKILLFNDTNHITKMNEIPLSLESF